MAGDQEGDIPGAIPLGVAIVLARHQLDTPLVFADPLAKQMTGLSDATLTTLVPSAQEFWVDLRLHLAMRNRFAADVVVSATESGISQLVVLDAGLDTTCYRRPYPGLRLFEVDSREVQTWKRQHLANIGVETPRNLAYVSLDSDRHGLRDGMETAGYDLGSSTVVIWLNRTFQAPQAITYTLMWLGEHRGRLEVVLDYNPPPDAMSAVTRKRFVPLVGEMTDLGQPYLSFSTSAQMQNELRARDFEVVEDLTWADLLARYQPARLEMPDPDGGCVMRAIRRGIAEPS